METDRRTIIKTATAASFLMAGLSVADVGKAGEISSVAPLIAAGLEPLAVYRKMFASADKNEGRYWLFTGPITIDVEGVGPACKVQEETFRALRTEDINRDAFHIYWREAGVLRDFTTGDVVSTIYDPIKGESAPRNGALHTDPSRFTISKSGDNLSVALVYPSAAVLGVTVGAEVTGDRVSLTHTEYKLRPTRKTAQCSTLKIYSSLAELKSGTPSVAAQGFYSIRNMDTGNVVIAGVKQNAKMDEKLNPLAWERTRERYPEFFDGDRIALNWK
jgi:hypothetical protein